MYRERERHTYIYIYICIHIYIYIERERDSRPAPTTDKLRSRREKRSPPGRITKSDLIDPIMLYCS